MSTSQADRHHLGTRPVVVGVDGSSAAHAALAWATFEAIRHQVPLHIVHAVSLPVDYGPGLSITQVDYDALRREGNSLVTAATAIAREIAAGPSDLVISTFVLDAPPIPVLRDRAANARIIALGTRGMGMFKRTLIGSVSTALSRHSPCPVAVVPEPPEEGPDRSDAAVVVGVDGSPHSTEAVRLAFDEASSRGVELVAVHSWNDYGHLSWPADIDEAGNRLLAENLAGYDIDYPEVRVRRVVTEERPAKALIDATRSAQLVIVGSHGRGGFAGMTLGSVGQAVLHSAEGPIIIVRGSDTAA